VKELRITDAELQSMIAPALKAKLHAAGFQRGFCDAEHCGFFFPINLELAGTCTVTRNEDGTWTFTQQDNTITDRLDETYEIHAAAIETASQRRSA